MFDSYPPLDKREERHNAIIAKKAALAKERSARLLNSKQRYLGVDLRALEEQKLQKAEKIERERQEEALNHQATMQVVQHMNNVAHKTALERKQNDLLLAEVWRQQVAGRTQRAEADLADPKNYVFDYSLDDEKNQAFVKRIGINEVNLRGEEKEKQKEQFFLIGEKVSENQRMISEEKAVEANYVMESQYHLLKANEKAEEKARCAHAAALDIRRANEKLLEGVKQRSAAERLAFEAEAIAEYVSALNDRRLRESRTLEVGSAPGRVVTYQWKGMPPSELDAITQEQARQMNENQERRRAEQVVESAWAATEKATKEAADSLAASKYKKALEANMQTRVANEILDKGKKSRDSAEKVYRLQPGMSKSYWPYEKSAIF